MSRTAQLSELSPHSATSWLLTRRFVPNVHCVTDTSCRLTPYSNNSGGAFNFSKTPPWSIYPTSQEVTRSHTFRSVNRVSFFHCNTGLASGRVGVVSLNPLPACSAMGIQFLGLEASASRATAPRFPEASQGLDSDWPTRWRSGGGRVQQQHQAKTKRSLRNLSEHGRGGIKTQPVRPT